MFLWCKDDKRMLVQGLMWGQSCFLAAHNEGELKVEQFSEKMV